MITRAMRTIPKKVLEMFSDLPILGAAVESAVLMAAYRIPRPDPRNLGKGHNWISAKADNVDCKFNMNKKNI